MGAQKDPTVQEERHLITSVYQMAKEIERIKNDPTAVLEYAMNTAMTSSYEYTLLVDTVLTEQFHFTSRQMDEFHEYLREGMLALGEVHDAGANPMTLEDMKVVGEIAKIKAPMERALLLEKKLGIAPREDMSTLLKG